MTLLATFPPSKSQIIDYKLYVAFAAGPCLVAPLIPKPYSAGLIPTSCTSRLSLVSLYLKALGTACRRRAASDKACSGPSKLATSAKMSIYYVCMGSLLRYLTAPPTHGPPGPLKLWNEDRTQIWLICKADSRIPRHPCVSKSFGTYMRAA